MARIFVLEDDENRLRWFRRAAIGNLLHVAKNVPDAIAELEKHTFDQIFLDHDLADEHYAAWREGSDKFDTETGYAVAKWLGDNPAKSPGAQVIVHSMNPIGSERMASVMPDRTVVRMSFPLLQEAVSP